MTSKVKLKLKQDGYDIREKEITELPEDLGINKLYYLFKQLTVEELYRFAAFDDKYHFDNELRFDVYSVIVGLINQPNIVLTINGVSHLTKLIIEIGDQLTEEDRKNVKYIKSFDNRVNLNFFY